MEAVDRFAARRAAHRKRQLYYGIAGGVTLVIVLVVALSVSLTNRSKGGHAVEYPTAILLPLYGRPADDGWKPLVDQYVNVVSLREC